MGFVLRNKSEYEYCFRYSFDDSNYTDIHYHIDEDYYTLNYVEIGYNFIKLINDLLFDFHMGFSQESFKLFKRSETINKILNNG